MVSCYEYHPGATFGMAQDATHHVGMALAPAPLVLLDLPGVYDVAYQIQSIARVMFKEIVESISLAVAGSQMHV